MWPLESTKTIFELIQDIIGTILLTKFYDDRKINVTSRPRLRGGHVFQPTGIIFDLFQDIIGMNILTEFHEDRTINMASREKCPAPWRPCFSSKHKSPDQLNQDWTINVASRVLTRKNAPFPGGHFHEDWTINVASKVKKCPAPWQPCFSSKDISGTNLLSKFHKDRKINVAGRVLTRKNAPPPGGHVFQPTDIIFKLVQDIIGINLLAKFYEDRTINVASRVKNAPPLGSHIFQANVTIFKLIQDIIENNILTKFHEDWTIHVASRE
ncbi:hypothetical protein DPMN_111955 [Dreissena polymorpha]|uniref:Uncharacterized protein n=1 Tax=Dreissena polymorpha TaxID=45954 RepID=A0A9D4QQ85_DREPO|nr:hypothetical protein DPMN_111955 [Dreissena polymorpha]